MSHAHADLKEWVVSTRPEQIEALYHEPSRAPDRVLQHLHAEHMEWWCSDSEISYFISDTTQINNLLSALGSSTIFLGQNLQQLGISETRSIIIMPGCGCNTAYNNGGCSHGYTPAHRQQLSNLYLTCELHTASIMVLIVSHLLMHKDQAHKIVELILDRERLLNVDSRDL